MKSLTENMRSLLDKLNEDHAYPDGKYLVIDEDNDMVNMVNSFKDARILIHYQSPGVDAIGPDPFSKSIRAIFGNSKIPAPNWKLVHEPVVQVYEIPSKDAAVLHNRGLLITDPEKYRNWLRSRR